MALPVKLDFLPDPLVAAHVRPAVAGDVAFLSATWKQAAWRGCPAYNRVRWAIFAPHYTEIVGRLLQRCAVLVACDPEHEEEILGYVVTELPVAKPGPHEPSALVWAYVRPAFRRAGLFTALIRAAGLPPDLAGVEIVCATRTWFAIAGKYPGAVHNPFRQFMERP
jgi:GNAT superfamily N-acetyltransferase